MEKGKGKRKRKGKGKGKGKGKEKGKGAGKRGSSPSIVLDFLFKFEKFQGRGTFVV